MVKARLNKAHITYKLTEGGKPSIDNTNAIRTDEMNKVLKKKGGRKTRDAQRKEKRFPLKWRRSESHTLVRTQKS